MEAPFIEIYRKRIIRETVKTWNSYERRGRTDRLPHIARALPLLARLDGQPEEAPLTDWLERNTEKVSPFMFPQTADRITGTIVELWYQGSHDQPHPRTRHLLSAIRHIAAMGDRHRQTPLISYFREKIKQDQNHKATATAIACIMEYVVEPQEFLPLLLQAVEATNRRVRCHALLALLPVADSLDQHPEMIETIRVEMDRLWETSGHRQEALRQYPVHAIENRAKCAELLENSINDFVWAISAIVLGSVGPSAASQAVLTTLEKGLAGHLVVPQRIAAETIVRLGAAERLVNALLAEVNTDTIRPDTLHKLGVLGAVLPWDERILESILAATRHRSMLTRAEAIASLLPFSQTPPEVRLPCVRHLETMEQEANWLFHPLIGSVLDTFRRQLSREEYIATFKTFGNVSRQLWVTNLAFAEIAHGDMSDCLTDILRTDIEEESSGHLRTPRSLTGTRRLEPVSSMSPAHILYVEPAAHAIGGGRDGGPSQAQEDIQRKLLASRAYRNAASAPEVFLWGKGVVLLSFAQAEPVIASAIELSQALRMQVRMGLHCHEKIALQHSEERRWVIAGEGLNEARTITETGKAGHILLSRQARQNLPASLAAYASDYGRFSHAKQYLEVSLLYSGPLRFGAKDLHHVPTDERTRPPRIDRDEVRANTLSILAVFALLGVIGLALWFLSWYYGGADKHL